MRIRTAAVAGLFGAVAFVAAFAGPAGADPTHAKKAFHGMADCGTGGSFTFVVNNSNGQGKGAQNNTTAEFAPAHLDPGNGVFHPVMFDITFTFTPTVGPPQSFTDTSSRPNQTGNTTCQLSGSQTSPDGTFSLTGSVVGNIT
jgi:hypothetical protein